MKRQRPRATKLDPFLPLVRETLGRYPRTTQLWEILRRRGYTGSSRQLHRAVKTMKLGPTPEASPEPARDARSAGTSSADDNDNDNDDDRKTCSPGPAEDSSGVNE